VGIAGYKRVGKNLVASTLVEKYGYTRAALADPLKEMALAADPYVRPDDRRFERLSHLVACDGWEEAKRHVDVRRFLQRLGTEGARRHLGEDAWIEALKKKMLAVWRAGPVTYFVIPDVRFPNEAAAIKEWGGVVWRIHRPGYSSDGHPSESGVDAIEPNIILSNSGDVAHLEMLVECAMGETHG
jgi:hypothetical protein